HLGAAEARRARACSHRAVGDDDVGNAGGDGRCRVHQHAHRAAAAVGDAGGVADLLEADRADEFGFFDRVDGVADETVDFPYVDLRVGAGCDDRLARQLQLRAAGVAGELGLAHAGDRGRVPGQGLRTGHAV